MPKPYQRVEMNRPRRTAFSISNYKIFDCDLGQLIPVFHRKMVPGDSFRIGNEIVIRANPLVAPLMHEINVFVHYFFVPFRIMWPKPVVDGSSYPADVSSWEEFFTGGIDGTLEPVKPKWIPSTIAQTTLHTLWDYFGFPIDVIPVGSYPDVWPLRAYNMVWNEYYRDQNYMNEVDLDDWNLKRRCWEKDYFTTALPWQQRGQAPALPITGFTSAIWDASRIAILNDVASTRLQSGDVNNINTSGKIGTPNQPNNDSLRDFLNSNKVDLASASTFDVNDLRLAFQTQKFLERNARAGGRYIEQLKAHYGVSPRDDRMQRPEYIGGSRTPVIISEVLQTSQTSSESPQGTLAGHGITVDKQYIASYYAPEHGYVIGIMSMMPRPVYQQGIDRELLGVTRWDELLPEFVSLGEQAVYRAEIYATGVEAENKTVFGFQGRYDEYRTARNQVCGLLRNSAPNNLSFWHIARYFQTPPALNQEFLECNPRKDYLAVPDLPGWIVTFGNRVRAVRPLPAYGTPGLIDHH